MVAGAIWLIAKRDQTREDAREGVTSEERVASSPTHAGVPTAGAARSMPGAVPNAGSGLEDDAARVIGKRFPDARVRQERLETIGPGLERWSQLIQAEAPFSQVRADLVFETRGGEVTLIEQTYYLADSILLERPADLTPGQFAERLQRLGFKPVAQYPFSPAVRVLIPEPLHLDSVPEALQRVSAEEPGWKALPDHIAFSDAVPNDFDPRELWSLAKIGAPSAWEVSAGSSTVVVGIIDSGITLNHPDLAANIWQNPGESGNGRDDDGNGLADDLRGWDFADNDNDPTDTEGHGTHVAGIIGAVGDNATGLTGVAQRVKLIGLRAGNKSLATSAIVQALDYLTNLKTRGVPIVAVNNSYTSSTPNNLQRDSIIRARDADILFVAAAGNDARDIDQGGLLYPVGFALSNIIGVASTSLSDTLSDFSNWGATSVHIAAPGSSIVSTLPGGLYGVKEGTSMAAPLVAGAAALLRSAEPALGAAQLKARMLSSAKPLPGFEERVASGGRLDLQSLINPAAGLPAIVAPLPTADLHAIENTSKALVLGARGVRMVGGEEQAGLPVVWSKVSGPGNVTFLLLPEDRVSVSFSQEGLYRLMARVTSGGTDARLHRTIAVGPSASVSPSQLLARWTFGEESGPPQDSSGQGRHGTLLDGPVRDAGPGGASALRFNGTVSAMKFSAPGPNQVTLAGWMRMESNGNSVFPRLLHFPAYYLFPGMDSWPNPDANVRTVKFLANWTGVDGVWYSQQEVLGAGVWHHLAATYDGTKGTRELPRLYLNGRELDVAAQVGAEGQIDLTAGDGYLGNNEERSRALQGLLADVRIYGRQLGSEEIALLAKGGVLESLRRWEIYVKSTSENQTVVGLRLADGRLPAPSLTAVWQQISGSGSPHIVDSNGTEATLGFSQTGPHNVTVDLFEDGVMLRREMTLSLPGTVASPVPPGFVRGPVNRIAAVGSTFTFDSDATGTPPLSFQWFRDGVPLTGQVLPQLMLLSLTTAHSGSYTVRVSNVAGSVTSEPAVLSVLTPPSIMAHPAGKLVAAGSTVELSVSAAGSPPLTYQWFRNGGALIGATHPTLVLADIVSSQNGDYTVQVSNPVGSVTSHAASVEVLQPPSILSQPLSQTILAGRTIVLDVQVGGSVPYTFAWYKEGVPLPGENSTILRFTTIRTSDSGSYTFKVSNAVGSATTVPIVLNVISAPIITRQPAAQTVAAGGMAAFSVEATGSAPLSYQWQKDSLSIPGANGPELVIGAVGAQHVGGYAVVITNEVGTVRSQTASLNLIPTPALTAQPQSVTVAQGDAAFLQVASSDNPATLSYRWWRNGDLIAGASASRLELASVGPEHVGIYQAELINGAGSTLSRPAIVGMIISTPTAGSIGTRAEWQNIVHPNGNVYDQFVMNGNAGSLTAAAGQISRVSFVDPQGDIVQVEMSGRGTLTVALANPAGPAEAASYNQPGVLYMQGQATLVLADSDESTHLSVFSVGPLTNPAVVKPGMTYESWASVRALGVLSAVNRVGGLRLGNGRFEATVGITGLWAPNVASPTVFLSDIAAFSAATPALAMSNDTEIGITGGGLLQPNQKSIQAEGISGLRMRAGMSSSGQVIGPSTLLGRIVREGVDITSSIVLPAQ